MSDDFDSFKNSDGGEPPDGSILPAKLERASVFESQRGDRFLKTEWSSGRYWWEYLRGTSGFGRQMAQELVVALGIDMSSLKDWEELGDELATREGVTYTVRVERNGNFLNTFVEDRPQGVQEALPDIPIDEADFEPAPAGAGSAAGLDDLDDIPF